MYDRDMVIFAVVLTCYAMNEISIKLFSLSKESAVFGINYPQNFRFEVQIQALAL